MKKNHRFEVREDDEESRLEAATLYGFEISGLDQASMRFHQFEFNVITVGGVYATPSH